MFGGDAMNCLICNADAHEFHNGFEGIECECHHCGHYAITDALLKIRHGRHFDVFDTRVLLAVLRGEHPHAVPVITEANVYWQRLLA